MTYTNLAPFFEGVKRAKNTPAERWGKWKGSLIDPKDAEQFKRELLTEWLDPEPVK